MILSEFEKLPIIGILRGITESMITPLAECCKNAGLLALEITMNTENAPQLIAHMKKASQGTFAVGAGTVLSIEDLEKAIQAGASFIVMPTVKPDVIKACAAQNIPCFPGAFTPTEIHQAWDLGASMVKVFPAGFLGSKYFKEVKGPLNNTKLLACGGISATTIKEYINSGADAVAFGGSIFKKEWLETKNYKAIELEIVKLIEAYT